MWSSFQPRRNFTVKGIVTAARTDSKILPISGRSRSRPLPPLHGDNALGRAAQVQVDHVEAGVFDDLAASRKRAGLEPKSCAEIGCSSS